MLIVHYRIHIPRAARWHLLYCFLVPSVNGDGYLSFLPLSLLPLAFSQMSSSCCHQELSPSLFSCSTNAFGHVHFPQRSPSSPSALRSVLVWINNKAKFRAAASYRPGGSAKYYFSVYDHKATTKTGFSPVYHLLIIADSAKARWGTPPAGFTSAARQKTAMDVLAPIMGWGKMC